MGQLLKILDMQTRNYKRIMERKAYLEECIKTEKVVIHRGDKYIIKDVQLVHSHLFVKQLYFDGVLVDKYDQRHKSSKA